MSREATPVLVAGARTPIGRLGGGLSRRPGVELGAIAARAALERCGDLRPDYVAMGNVLQGAGGQNPARQAAVGAGVDPRAPAITLNDVCLASMSSVALAASMLRAGEARAVLVGGFDSMSQAPHAIRLRAGGMIGDVPLVDTMVRDGLWCAIEDLGMGALSDRENARFGIDRVDQDAFAFASHVRACAAADAGRLAAEMAGGDDLPDRDEGIRADASTGGLARLSPAFTADGTITAGNASQLSDAGAAGLITTLGTARAAGLQPLCEIVDRAVVAGADGSLHLQPARAAAVVLERNGMTAHDVELWEINEAFAGVVLASAQALDLDLDRVNVNGGAIALGHPLGASGFRLVLTLAHELRRRGAELGVAAICGGGGQGQAMLLRTM